MEQINDYKSCQRSLISSRCYQIIMDQEDDIGSSDKLHKPLVEQNNLKNIEDNLNTDEKYENDDKYIKVYHKLQKFQIGMLSTEKLKASIMYNLIVKIQ